MTEASPRRPSPQLSRSRRLLRLFTQFSLRTLLLLMTVAAVGCWLMLRPEQSDEELAGDALRLSRQVRVVQITAAQPGAPPETRTIDSGPWTLHNALGDVFVKGQCERDQPHGVWTTYYPNGNRAANGKCWFGARSGVWQNWYEDGTLQSEATFVVSNEKDLGAQRIDRLPSGNPDYNRIEPLQGVIEAKHTSVRTGPAKAWHPNGRLRLEGAYTDDRRTGLWTTYDDQGQVVTRGEYVDDRRHGAWAERNTAGGLQRVAYVAGRTQTEHHRLIERFDAGLRSSNLARQIDGAARLADLGSDGFARLELAVLGASEAAQLVAVRALAVKASSRSCPLQAATLLACEQLTQHHDHRLVAWSKVLLYIERPDQRDALFTGLLDMIDAQPSDGAKRHQLAALCEAEQDGRPDFFLRLMQLVVAQVNVDDHPVSASDVDEIVRLRVNLPPLLDAASLSRDPRVRLGVVAIVDRLVRSASPGELDEYPIPAELQGVVDRCRSDPHDSVREQAEAIGHNRSSGGGGFF